MRTSRAASRSSKPSLTARMLVSIDPDRRFKARARARSVRARTSSLTASAWVRSSLPLRKARRVNSPGPAGRNPAPCRVSRTRRMITGLPWVEISAEFSPVKLLGSRNTAISTSSIRTLSLTAAPAAAGSHSQPCIRVCPPARSRLPPPDGTNSAASSASELGPDTRITARALCPHGVARAAIGSSGWKSRSIIVEKDSGIAFA